MAEFTDVSPEILEKLQGNRRVSTADSREAARILVKAEKGQATLRDAARYAVLRGGETADAIRNLSGSDLPNGQMYYNIAEKALQPVLEELSEDVLDVAGAAMGKVNRDAGIGLAVAVPDESEKIHGILNVASGDQWDDVKETVASAADNFAHKCVDDTIRENAERQYEAGLDAKVHRTPAPGACQWCADLAGTYDYEEVKRGSDVWCRHANCDCVIEYEPVKGQRQLVSSRDYHNNLDSLSPEEREAHQEEQWEKKLARDRERYREKRYGTSTPADREKRAEEQLRTAASAGTDITRIHNRVERSRIINEAIQAKQPIYADELRKAYNNANIKPRDGFTDVVLHGTQYYTFYEHKYRLDTETLSYIISGRKDCAGNNIRLISCSTGDVDKNGNCVAQELANRLKVDIWAPKGEALINPDGTITVILDDKEVDEEHGFQLFTYRY